MVHNYIPIQDVALGYAEISSKLGYYVSLTNNYVSNDNHKILLMINGIRSYKLSIINLMHQIIETIEILKYRNNNNITESILSYESYLHKIKYLSSVMFPFFDKYLSNP